MASVLFDYEVVFDGHGRPYSGVSGALATIDRWRDASGRPVRVVVLPRGAPPPQGAHASVYVGCSTDRCEPARQNGLKVLLLGAAAVGSLDAALPELHRLIGVAWLKPDRMDLSKQICDALACVSTKRIRQDLEALVNLGSRKAGSEGAAKAVTYLCDRFKEIGYEPANIETQEFDCVGCDPPHVKNHNVLCGRLASTRRSVLVGGHYDSTSPAGDAAPGADDNASGVAAILELAHVLKDRRLGFDVVYAAFGAEEVGRQGSKHCACVARTQNWPLDLVVNLDQIGYPGEGTGGRFVNIQHDHLNGQPANNLASLAFATVMLETARTYTIFEPDLTGLNVSDHRSFEKEGFTCIGVLEGMNNSRAHSKHDVLDRLSVTYVAEVTRMVLATILTLGA